MSNLTRINKFIVTATADTILFAYNNVESITLTPNLYNFNDGSIRVDLPGAESLQHRYFSINAFIESMDDLMIVAQIKDIIERHVKNPMFTLTITSPIYSRYDRVMFDNRTDSFGAKVFANFVNSLGFNSVTVIDCHSEVMVDLINNCQNVPQSLLLEHTVASKTLKEFVIAPDKGARKKLESYVYSFGKVRNPETGRINKIALDWVNPIVRDPEFNVSNEFLVVDDLCENGGTFLGVWDEFMSKYDLDHMYPPTLNLYVTHGVFPTTEVIPRLLAQYSKLFVYIMKESTYNAVPEVIRSRLIVNVLVKD